MKNYIAAITLAATLFVPAISAQAQSPVKWLFGMNVAAAGGGLQIRSIVPGGAAYRAGLRPGDTILQANNVPFNQVYNDFQGIAMLQQAADMGAGGGGGGGGQPTATSTNFNFNPSTAVRLLIRRPCGTVLQKMCYPFFNGNPGGNPTAQ